MPEQSWLEGVKARAEYQEDGWVRVPYSDWHGVIDCFEFGERKYEELELLADVLARQNTELDRALTAAQHSVTHYNRMEAERDAAQQNFEEAHEHATRLLQERDAAQERETQLQRAYARFTEKAERRVTALEKERDKWKHRARKRQCTCRYYGRPEPTCEVHSQPDPSPRET